MTLKGPTFNPLTIKQWQRFKSIRRGYWSAVALGAALLLSAGAELLVNSRALMVSYQGSGTSQPTLTTFRAGRSASTTTTRPTTAS